MNKDAQVARLAEAAGLTKTQAKEAYNSFVEMIINEVNENGKIKVDGLGTIEKVERKPRMGRNPKTNEEIQIPGSFSSKLKPSKGFKEVLNA